MLLALDVILMPGNPGSALFPQVCTSTTSLALWLHFAHSEMLSQGKETERTLVQGLTVGEGESQQPFPSPQTHQAIARFPLFFHGVFPDLCFLFIGHTISRRHTNERLCNVLVSSNPSVLCPITHTGHTLTSFPVSPEKHSPFPPKASGCQGRQSPVPDSPVHRKRQTTYRGKNSAA